MTTRGGFQRSMKSVDTSAVDIQVELANAKSEIEELKKAAGDRSTEIGDLTEKLKEATERANSFENEKKETEAARDTQIAKAEMLKTALDKTDAAFTSKVAEIEAELRDEKDTVSRLQMEVHEATAARETEQKEKETVHDKLASTLEGLSTLREEMEQEQLRNKTLTEEKGRMEAKMEDIMLQLAAAAAAPPAPQPPPDTVESFLGWSQSSQLWMSTALTACGTATVVSFLFVRYYSKA